MSFTHCNICRHEFSNKDNDVPHADGGFMEVNHGGGVCEECFIRAGHPLCENGHLNYDTSKFCHECGVKLVEIPPHPPLTAENFPVLAKIWENDDDSIFDDLSTLFNLDSPHGLFGKNIKDAIQTFKGKFGK